MRYAAIAMADAFLPTVKADKGGSDVMGREESMWLLSRDWRMQD